MVSPTSRAIAQIKNIKKGLELIFQLTEVPELTEATLASVRISDRVHVDGFMLADGSYRIPLIQIAEAVGAIEETVFDFLKSEDIRSLLGKSYTFDEIESGVSRFKVLPLEAANAYWLWQSFKGNEQALILTSALMADGLARIRNKA